MNLAVLQRINKALGATAAALPTTSLTAAVAGGKAVGYVIAVISAFLVGLITYLMPANKEKGEAGTGRRRKAAP